MARTRTQKHQPTYSAGAGVCASRVAVEVGFEPTEGLPPHTLSRSADGRSPPVCSVRELAPNG